jgi:hypothetical protein
MPKRSLKSCVPVSTAGKHSPEKASQPVQSRDERTIIGFNRAHEARLITSLCEYYGWTLCADGNLYNPHGGSYAQESLAA